MNPGLLYTLITGLSASVLTRPRAFPIRLLAPPIFTIAGLRYFLPKTYHNLRSYLSDAEDAHFPEFAASHDRFNASLSTHWEMLKSRVEGVTGQAQNLGGRVREGVEGATGLRLGNVAKAVEAKQAETEKDIGAVGPVKRVGVVVEQKPVAEVVAPVDSTPAGSKRIV